METSETDTLLGEASDILLGEASDTLLGEAADTLLGEISDDYAVLPDASPFLLGSTSFNSDDLIG